MPPLTSQEGIRLSYGSRLPTSTVVGILPGLSRVRLVGLRQDAVGGVFLDAPSTLCGSRDCPQGTSGLPAVCPEHLTRLLWVTLLRPTAGKFRLSR
jgi:hypothetical protein